MTLLKRIIVAVIFIPLILAACFNGGIPLLLLLSLFSGIGLYELRQLLCRKYEVIPFIVIPLGVLFLWVFSLIEMPGVLFSFLALVMIVAGYDIFFNRIEGSAVRLALSCAVIIYQPFLYSMVYRLRELSNGEFLVISLIILVWITDTFAYFMGMLLGKHRGLLKVSPRKSLEGFLFGLFFSFVGAFILGYFFREKVTISMMVLAAVSAGIFGQMGDLLESLIKRDVGVKDSSNIIPGHGGILDRFDSFIIAAPTYYVLYLLFIR